MMEIGALGLPGFVTNFISKDQLEDYANRKSMGIEETERWLAPNLNYDV